MNDNYRDMQIIGISQLFGRILDIHEMILNGDVDGAKQNLEQEYMLILGAMEHVWPDSNDFETVVECTMALTPKLENVMGCSPGLSNMEIGENTAQEILTKLKGRK